MEQLASYLYLVLFIISKRPVSRANICQFFKIALGDLRAQAILQFQRISTSENFVTIKFD